MGGYYKTLLLLVLFSSSLIGETISYEFNNGGWASTSTTKNLQSYMQEYIDNGETDASFIALSAHASQYIPVRNIEIDGVPIDDTPWQYEIKDRQITSSYPYKKGLFIKGNTDTNPAPLLTYYQIATRGFYNGSGSPRRYQYKITIDGEGGEDTILAGTVTVPNDAYLDFTGLQHKQFVIEILREDLPDFWSFIGYFSPVAKQAETLPAEYDVSPNITEGEPPDEQPDEVYTPEWDQRPDFIPPEERDDVVGENRQEVTGDMDDNNEASNDDIIIAIKAHDHNREEEHQSNEHLWQKSEDALDTRFTELNNAQESRWEKQKAKLVDIQEELATANQKLGDVREGVVDMHNFLEATIETPGEGVDEIEVDGEAPEFEEGEELFAPDPIEVQDKLDDLFSFLPDLPSFPNVNARKYDFDYGYTLWGQRFDIEFDLSDFAPIMNITRNVGSLCLLMLFSYGSVITIRRAFA